MAHIIEIQNPFKPLEDTKRHEHPGGLTIRAWLEFTYPGFKEFTHPTICIVNGNPLLRAQWDVYIIQPADIINFVLIPQDPITILYVLVIVAIAFSVYIILTMPKPNNLSNTEPDPVYDLKGQRNQNRLTYPIEVPYGACRLFPSYAARAYNKYVNNEQYQYQLLCLGHGYYDVSQILIEDTPIGNFQDVTYAIYEPGEQVVLFPDNVITSVEVAGIEMFGPNEPEYDSWIGGFVANDANTLASKLEVDLVLPQGLYFSNDSGGLDNRTINATFEYRAIDSAGAPLGGWVLLFNFSKSLKTNTPQRFTLEADVAQGRYEVRGRRTNNKDTSARASNVLQWAALRAFLPSTKDYGDVTLLAIRARATNNLNDRASNRINCRATRKLRSWNKATQSWNARAATRSIVWAFADLFTANYGGRLDDSRLDLDALADLDEVYTEREEYFDHVFDQRGTVWEAAKIIARCGRALPMISGSRITMIREAPKTLPTAVFNQDNIVENSFKWEIKLPNIDENDSVEVEYIDSTTWKQETVLCTLPGGTTDNPEQIKLLGCTDREHAYHEGMFIRAQRRYLRENVTFKTGLEGHIPSYGDLISISHDLPRWGQAGQVLDVNGTELILSDEVTFGVGTHFIALRKKDGSQAGPFIATVGDAPNKVIVASGIGSDYFFDDINERPLFLFGVTDAWGKLMTVVSLAPDGEEIEVKAVVYNPVIYSFDVLEAPPLDNPSLPPSIPDLPAVADLVVATIPDSIRQVLISWTPAIGAQSYLIEKSFNGTDWESVDRTQVTSYILDVVPSFLYIRVAGLNLAAGPWATWSGTVGDSTVIPSNVVGLELQSAFTGTFAKLQWSSVPTAQGYKVRVYQDAGATLMRTATLYDLTYTYSIEDALTDGSPDRALQFKVTGFNNIGESETPTILNASNPAPAAITSGLSTSFVDDDGTNATYNLAWGLSSDVDVNRYRVWGSATDGFTPGPGNLLFEGNASAVGITIALTAGAHPAYYWRVAALDIWGDEFNASAQQTVPAYP